MYGKEQWEQSSLDDVYTLESLKSEKNCNHSEFTELTGTKMDFHLSRRSLCWLFLTIEWLSAWGPETESQEGPSLRGAWSMSFPIEPREVES